MAASSYRTRHRVSPSGKLWKRADPINGPSGCSNVAQGPCLEVGRESGVQMVDTLAQQGHQGYPGFARKGAPSLRVRPGSPCGNKVGRNKFLSASAEKSADFLMVTGTAQTLIDLGMIKSTQIDTDPPRVPPTVQGPF
ncbi:hypothetical protein CIHG_06565 [Coccidioides immitis H538.4]|uniref:Uncharacterized protein n=3 Tax=Coccidioides immitis TaxID=5501 RepID=A0A0J8QMK5_COCIT|nr:hypothetical protein CIRG_07979 [Coccidioides immitis RMSCC 2394]KMU72443.1 hypothetical protein CISG_03091 [Coccidioides immitis RMSCC 3703]KMU88627.1 hypothetical protein CIHG_06565 [Coccidioides immitis H538.4]